MRIDSISCVGSRFVQAVLVICLAVALSRISRAEERIKWQSEMAGQWSSWIEGDAATTLPLRAIPYHQVVYRRGPPDSKPVQLFEETSTGRVRFCLRDDGLLFVQPVSEPARIYGVNPESRVFVPFLPPPHWDKFFPPYQGVSQNGFVAWLGDVLFYGRYVYSDQYLVGYVRIDAQRLRITEQRIVLEAKDEYRTDNVEAAKIATPGPMRIGHYLFWNNRGNPSAIPELRFRRARVIDLVTGNLKEIESLPPQFLKDHASELRMLTSESK